MTGIVAWYPVLQGLPYDGSMSDDAEITFDYLALAMTQPHTNVKGWIYNPGLTENAVRRDTMGCRRSITM